MKIDTLDRQCGPSIGAILPDAWPVLMDGAIRCPPWVAALYDAPDAFVAELNARELKAFIERGAYSWRSWKIMWEVGQRESVIKRIDESQVLE